MMCASRYDGLHLSLVLRIRWLEAGTDGDVNLPISIHPVSIGWTHGFLSLGVLLESSLLLPLSVRADIKGQLYDRSILH